MGKKDYILDSGKKAQSSMALYGKNQKQKSKHAKEKVQRQQDQEQVNDKRVMSNFEKWKMHNPDKAILNIDDNSNSRKQHKNSHAFVKFKQNHKIQKKNPTPPNSVQEFFQAHQKFGHKIFPNLKNYNKQMVWVNQYKTPLYELLIQTLNEGGIESVISQGYKKRLFSSFTSKFNVQTSQHVFDIYKHYLFYYEYSLLQDYPFRSYRDPTKYFHQATFVSEKQLDEFLKLNPLDTSYFNYDILVFRNGQQSIGVNSQEINLDKVSNMYKDYLVDIRVQKPMDYGFTPRKLMNLPYQMKVSNYRDYQRLCQKYSLKNKTIDQDFFKSLGPLQDELVNKVKFKDRIKSGQIFFAVNFDPQDGILLQHITEKVKGTFLGFKEQFDLLSYLDHQIPGCSFPQFYFKVKGVWTGGHQENVNMCAVNINHGPDSSEWYTMQHQYVQQFRFFLKEKQKMDLYGSQGLWFQRLNWFVEHGYPVKKIIQKKGDIVISGPGTLHWVRSHGIALQSAWNLFPITLPSLKLAYSRQQENQKIKFVRSNVIPLKILTLKLLNHQSQQITPEIRKLCIDKIKLWYKNQQDIYFQLEDKYYFFGQEKKLQDIQGFCQKCKQQIFLYFVYGNKCQDVVCLNCYKQSEKLRRKNRKVYIRHTKFDILTLIKLTQKGQPFEEIQSLCNAPYVGNIMEKCAKNNYSVEKDEFFIQASPEFYPDQAQIQGKYGKKKIKIQQKKFNWEKKQSESERQREKPIIEENQEQQQQQQSENQEAQQKAKRYNKSGRTGKFIIKRKNRKTNSVTPKNIRSFTYL